jgi:hypothetical protein
MEGVAASIGRLGSVKRGVGVGGRRRKEISHLFIS